MLVLSRQLNERLIIRPPGGPEIVIVICEIRQQNGKRNVRLGIDAPQEVIVHRAEVQARIDAEGRK